MWATLGGAMEFVRLPGGLVEARGVAGGASLRSADPTWVDRNPHLRKVCSSGEGSMLNCRVCFPR